MDRWHETKTDKQSEQTYETEPYRTVVIGPAPNTSTTAQELRHAAEQLALTQQYLGRGRTQSTRQGY